MAKRIQKLITKRISSFHFIISCLVIFVVVAFAYALYQFHQVGLDSKALLRTLYWNTIGIYYSFIPTPTPTPAVITPNTPTPTITSAPTPVPSITYLSDKLGVSFSYIPYFPNGIGQYFFAKEINDTVYLYWVPGSNQPFSSSDAEFLQTIAPGSKSVEVFNKDPQLSLTDAIKLQFLAGYSEADCSIVYPYRNGYPREDMSYQTAAIRIFRSPTHTRRQLDAKLAKCPAGYTEGGRGILYFMMDPKHPDKLLFVKIGQDNLPSGVGGLTWDGTIKVLQ